MCLPVVIYYVAAPNLLAERSFGGWLFYFAEIVWKLLWRTAWSAHRIWQRFVGGAGHDRI